MGVYLCNICIIVLDINVEKLNGLFRSVFILETTSIEDITLMSYSFSVRNVVIWTGYEVP